MEEIKDEVVVEEVIEPVVETQPETVDKATYDALLADLETVKAKLPVEQTEAEKALQAKQTNLWTREVNLELKEADLSDFAEFISVKEGDSETLTAQIKKFKEVLGKRELSNSYIPNDHRATDKYSLAQKQKDTKSMIGTKLAGLFK